MTLSFGNECYYQGIYFQCHQGGKSCLLGTLKFFLCLAPSIFLSGTASHPSKQGHQKKGFANMPAKVECVCIDNDRGTLLLMDLSIMSNIQKKMLDLQKLFLKTAKASVLFFSLCS